MDKKTGIAKITGHLRLMGIPFVTEHIFLKTRKWRMDIALLDPQISIEFHGGQFLANNAANKVKEILLNMQGKAITQKQLSYIFNLLDGNGGHQSASGFGHDMFKLNAAIMMGWLNLTFTTEHVENMQYVQIAINAALASRKKELNKHELIFKYGVGSNTKKRNNLKMDKKYFQNQGLKVT